MHENRTFQTADTVKTISAGTVIRTLCLLLALVNQVLSALGKSPLPIEDETVAELISAGVTVAAAVTAWWKNNSITTAAIEADQQMQELKRKEKTL